MGTSLAPDFRLLDKQEDERLRQANEASWVSANIAMLKEWGEVTNSLRKDLKHVEDLIVDAYMCRGSEFSGDPIKMVEYLIERARRPYPRRILEAEASVTRLRELLRHCLSLLSDFGIGQERIDVIGEIQDELAKE
jgi:hypothetical protein